MSHRNVLSSSSNTRGFRFGLQPAPAWSAILGFILFSALFILAGASSILRSAFPLGAFTVAVFLYRRYPLLYLGFTWWLWFLTPWVRRLIDYRGGSVVEPSLVLLAPFLVTGVTLATFLRYFPKEYRQDGLPFVLSFTGVFYACLIGLVHATVGDSSRFIKNIILDPSFTYTLNNLIIGTLSWLTPILFSFHLFVNWQYYPEYRQNIQRTFLWGVLVMGAYGVVQYLVAPEWDRLWLIQAIKTGGTSFGIPEPLGIRVFSTMNSTGPFAFVMMGGLLLLLSGKGTLRLFATVVGYLSFLLALVRTAWGGWVVGLLVVMSSLKAHLQMRLIITILMVGICTFPLTTMEPFSEIINSRFETFSNVQEDGSYKARSASYNRVLGVAILEPIGYGLGHPGFDSGFIDIPIALGWLGGIPYMGGLILLLFKVMQCTERRFDPFMSSALGVGLSNLAIMPLGNPTGGVQGVTLWGFLAMVLAGHKYYQHQRTARLKSVNTPI